MKSVGLFLGFALTLWVLVAVPARYFLGEWAVAYSGTAALVCVVPAVGTLAWATWARIHSPESMLVVVLGGTGVRLFVVSVAALVFESSFPFFREYPGFWAWLLGFYLATLTLEMGLLLSGQAGNHK